MENLRATSYDDSSVTLGGHTYTVTNGKGRLTNTGIQTNNAFTIESYDPAGRLQDLWQCTPFNCINSPYWDMHYQYTAGGYVNDYVHPAGYTITNNIANDGRNEEIQSSLIDSKHPNQIVSMSYAPQGALSAMSAGCAGSGCTSVRQDYDYNNRLQLVRLQLGSQLNESSMGCWVYNYYPSVGNPSSCTIPSQASSDDGDILGTYYNDAANSSLSHTAAYAYDPTHRLTGAAATGNSTYNLAFSFDRYGNMTCSQNQNTNGPCPQYSFNSSTNQISNSGYTYDASGDLTGDGVHTYQYDAEGRMTSVDNGTTASYIYNALGQRVEKDVAGTYTEYLFDGDGNPIGENNRSGWTDTWLIFNGQHVAHYQNGETYFMHANNVGTTAFVTDYSGAAIQDETHYPWGEQWKMMGTMQEERYAGMRHRDAETGLDPTQYRMHSSSQYRWFTPDPAQAGIFTPESMSAYAYSGGNPVSSTDAVGLAPCYGMQQCASYGRNYATAQWGFAVSRTWLASGSGSCYANGVQTSCGLVSNWLTAGAAVHCPNNYCGPIEVTSGSLTAFAEFNPNGAHPGYQQATPWTYLGLSLQQFQADYFAQLGATVVALQHAGASAAAIGEFIAANNSPKWATVSLGGGNFDFGDAGLFGGLANSCAGARCTEGSLGTLDFSHGNRTFHLDTGNPYSFPGGTLTHFGVDLLGGNFWYTVIPR